MIASMKENSAENPHHWAFRVYNQTGRTNKALIKLSIMIQKDEESRVIRMLEGTCKLNNQIAVSSSLLTAHERRKYADRKIPEGKFIYYIFPEEAIPQTIFIRINPIEGKRVYEKNDS